MYVLDYSNTDGLWERGLVIHASDFSLKGKMGGISRYTVVSGTANAQFLCSNYERMFHYSNNKGNWLEEFQQEPCHSRIFSNDLFKESLISHSFFPMQSLGGKPYFLRGLGTLLMLDDLVSCSVYFVPCVQYIRSKLNKLHVHRKVFPVPLEKIFAPVLHNVCLFSL